MDLSSYKAISINGTPMKKVLIGGVVAWVRPIVNWVKKSINADGTPYNGGLGYKAGYRVRSGGAEGQHGSAACTGFIPVVGGDTVRIYPVDTDDLSASGTAINAYDASFAHLGQAASNGNYGIFETPYQAYNWGKSCVNEGNGVYRWIVPPSASKVAYIRVSIGTNDGGNRGSRMIVTINEEVKL